MEKNFVGMPADEQQLIRSGNLTWVYSLDLS